MTTNFLHCRYCRTTNCTHATQPLYIQVSDAGGVFKSACQGYDNDFMSIICNRIMDKSHYARGLSYSTVDSVISQLYKINNLISQEVKSRRKQYGTISI
jgi:hypothetical protein